MSAPAAPDVDPGWWTAPVLSAVAGAVDAAGFLVLFGLFTAHVTGNTTGFGVAVGGGDWSEALKRFSVIPVFAVSTAVGVAVAEGIVQRDPTAAGRARALWALLVTEAVVLLAFTISAATFGASEGFTVNSAPFFFVAALAAVAMGTQNAALRRVAGLSVHTTFMTGQLTEAAVSSVHWRRAEAALRVADRSGDAGSVDGPADAQERQRVLAERDHARASVRLSLAVWCAYIAGATAGAWLVIAISRWVVLVLVVVILAVAADVARRARVTSSATS